VNVKEELNIPTVEVQGLQKRVILGAISADAKRRKSPGGKVGVTESLPRILRIPTAISVGLHLGRGKKNQSQWLRRSRIAIAGSLAGTSTNA